MASIFEDKISVLVPAFNAERYLSDCLESVLSQADGNFELIVVDDGSSDGSGAILEEYARAYPDRVRVHRQPNRGLILARRQGVALARGELCMFLDADDMLAPGALEKIRAIIGKTGADIVLFNYENLYEPSGETEAEPPVFLDGSLFAGENKRAVYEELLRSWRLNNLVTKAIRTPLVREDDTPYEDYAHLRLGEDLLQSLYPLTHARRIAYCAEALYIYRHTRDSMIGAAGGSAPEDDAIGDRLESYMALWGMDTPEARALFAKRRLGELITSFWQAYRAAGTREGRRAAVSRDWAARLTPDMRACLQGRGLGLRQRAQLWAILRRRRALLYLMERAGGRKIRRQYGE
ncbi:MAG: glycosyltransferase family A protein [Clostridia bacterium]|nr:glycosyltransferase family A protein [Clostridia bacterium]